MPIKMTTKAKTLTPDEFAKKYADRVRKGKTAKDKARGANQQRLANQEARASWSNDPRRTGSNHPNHKS